MRPAASLLRVRNITELVTATTYTCNIFLATLEHAPTPTCRNDVGEAAVGGGEVVRVVWGARAVLGTQRKQTHVV